MASDAQNKFIKSLNSISTCRAFCYALTITLIFLITIITSNTIYYSTREPAVTDICSEDNEAHDFIKLTQERKDAFKNFLEIKTITYGVNSSPFNNSIRDVQEFEKYKQFVESRYASIFNDTRVSTYWMGFTLLFHIKPANPVDKKLPILLLSHIDVVPAVAEDWDSPPFVPTEEDGYVYARGVIDNKNAAFANFEALGHFLKDEQRKVHNNIFIGFSHNEEGGSYRDDKGALGAHLIKNKIKELGWQRLEYVWDEGGLVVREVMKGVTTPVALVGVCEKNYLDVAIEINDAGGHSSMSTLNDQTVLKMSKIIKHLADNYDIISPVHFDKGPESHFLDNLVPHLKPALQVVMSNRWIFGKIVEKILLKKGSSAALIRTIMGFTQFHAGYKNNVQPASAKLNINFRTHPFDQPREVLARVQKLVADEFDFKVSVTNRSTLDLDYGKNGCNLDTTTLGFRTLKTNLQKVYQNEIVVTPYLCVANTDARHFEDMSLNVYRFAFFDYHLSDVKRFHGINERITWTNVERTINFHYHVLADSNEACNPTSQSRIYNHDL